MKLQVDINQNAIDGILATADGYIPKIETVREMASTIIGMPVKSMTGEIEVNEFLTLKDYPNASKSTAANLLGCKLEYEAYKANLSDLQRLKRFDVEKGRVIVSKGYKAIIAEENTIYLEGEYITQYQALETAAKAINKANSLLPNSIAHKILKIDHAGFASVNLALFHALVINPRC